MADRVAWVFRDYSVSPGSPEEYFFEINPNQFSLPLQKNLSYSATAAEDGRALIFEGRDNVTRIPISGVILTEELYDTLVSWYQKRTQIQLVDDLDREFWVYFTSLNLTRKRSIKYPWRHEYSAELVVLDWAG